MDNTTQPKLLSTISCVYVMCYGGLMTRLARLAEARETTRRKQLSASCCCCWWGSRLGWAAGFLLDQSVIRPFFASFFDPRLHPSSHPSALSHAAYIPLCRLQAFRRWRTPHTRLLRASLQGGTAAVADASSRGRACFECRPQGHERLWQIAGGLVWFGLGRWVWH